MNLKTENKFDFQSVTELMEVIYILKKSFINSGSSQISTGTILLFPYCRLEQILDMYNKYKHGRIYGRITNTYQ
jgi:hypothetical protein